MVVDRFTLPLPEELPPGGYTLVAGFYNPDTAPHGRPAARGDADLTLFPPAAVNNCQLTIAN